MAHKTQTQWLRELPSPHREIMLSLREKADKILMPEMECGSVADAINISIEWFRQEPYPSLYFIRLHEGNYDEATAILKEAGLLPEEETKEFYCKGESSDLKCEKQCVACAVDEAEINKNIDRIIKETSPRSSERQEFLEVAKAAMQGMLANHAMVDSVTDKSVELISESAEILADALISRVNKRFDK